jgi:hypothetical protein
MNNEMFQSLICSGSVFLLAAVASAFHPHPHYRPISTMIPRRRLRNIMSTSSGGSSRSWSRSGASNGSNSNNNNEVDGPLPELVVFDLDACFWDQEMYTLSRIPTESDVVMGDLNGRGVGVASVISGRSRISLHDGSLLALQNHHDGMYPNTRVCFASSADTELAENIGRATLKLLEVIPGVTVWDLVVNRDWDGVDVNQIGRRPPLSSNKSATHFPILRELTRVRYDRMLFFDGERAS